MDQTDKNAKSLMRIKNDFREISYILYQALYHYGPTVRIEAALKIAQRNIALLERVEDADETTAG